MSLLSVIFVPHASHSHGGPPPPDWFLLLFLFWVLAIILVPLGIHLHAKLNDRNPDVTEDRAMSWYMGIIIGGIVLFILIGIIAILSS